MVDDETAARALAEKNRLDPPPDGKEWSLGWDGDGNRAMEFDRLVTVEVPTMPALSPAGEWDGVSDDGYDHVDEESDGVRSDLVHAALLAIARLDHNFQLNGLEDDLGDVTEAAKRMNDYYAIDLLMRIALRDAFARLQDRPNG